MSAVSEQGARNAGRMSGNGALAGRGPLSGGVALKQHEKEEKAEQTENERENAQGECSSFPEEVTRAGSGCRSIGRREDGTVPGDNELYYRQALDANNEKLSQDISRMVNEKVTQEIEYLFRASNEKEEERFKQLDEIIRSYQKDNRGRAKKQATKIPFFKKKKFGKNKTTQM